MILAIPKNEIIELLKLQLNNFFVLKEEEIDLLLSNFDLVLSRCETCFALSTNKYYNRNGQVYFNPYHSVQYMIFLYFYSNTIYNVGNLNTFLCDKIYYLNKMLNGVDLLYAVELPDFWGAEHPVGSVIGRAKIGNGFMFFQNCTIGGIESCDGYEVYPIIGNNVHLYANSSIIGKCIIGDNVNIGAGALVKNQDVPRNSNVFGHSPNLIIKPKKRNNEIL